MKDKTIIITGAARGFGEGIARELFKQGANLVLVDIIKGAGIKLEEELNSSSSDNTALFIECDVTDYDAVHKMANTVVNNFGGIDILISNAGILHAGGLDEMDTETFEMVTRVNYQGYFNCVKAVSSHMIRQHKNDKGRFMDI
ncbi:MAG TPA: short-chain dehydrogenase, partial [Bacteroidales bacterium]|nr:short-chain dehydrogenase [Bacteroidales bacterium]